MWKVEYSLVYSIKAQQYLFYIIYKYLNSLKIDLAWDWFRLRYVCEDFLGI